MSIYRKYSRGAPDDIQTNTTQWRPEIREALSRVDALREYEEGRRRSNAVPCDTPLPRTLAWAAELPREAQPQELIRSFPRIANLLAADWREPDATYRYFSQLLFDLRGNRNGFPPEVAIELRALAAYYERLHPLTSDTSHHTRG